MTRNNRHNISTYMKDTYIFSDISKGDAEAPGKRNIQHTNRSIGGI